MKTRLKNSFYQVPFAYIFAFLFLQGSIYAQEARPAEKCINFKTCDKNQDKFIDQNECNFASFNKFDKNRDGKLSSKEHRRLLRFEKKEQSAKQIKQQQKNQQQKMNLQPNMNQNQRSNKDQGKRKG